MFNVSSGVRHLLGVIAIVATTLTSLWAEELRSGPNQGDPTAIRVLLLQPIDEPVPPMPRSRVREQIVRLEQQYHFIARHFVVLGEGLAMQAAQTEPTIRIDTSQARTAEALDALAARAGADWVVNLILQEVAYDDDPAFDGTRFRARAKLKVQIRDSRRGTWMLNVYHIGRASGGAPPPEIQLDATRAAASEALTEALAAFPEVVLVSRDGAITDFFRGQKEPFLGNPSDKPFQGISPPRSLRAVPNDNR